REVVAREMQQRVLQHAGVSRAEHETVALAPARIARVRAQKALEDRVGQGSQRHRGAGMPGVGLLHSVHRQSADRVDRQLADLWSLHRTDPSGAGHAANRGPYAGATVTGLCPSSSVMSAGGSPSATRRLAST